MTISNILLTVVTTAGIAIAAFLGYILWQRERRRAEIQFSELRFREEEFRAQDRERYRTEDLERTSRSLLDDMNDRVRQLESAVSSIGTLQTFNLEDTPAGESSLAVDVDLQSTTTALRQISHSLGTPLSRIKADALELGDKFGAEDVAERIITCVNLSNAYLGAFRRLNAIGRPGGSSTTKVWKIRSRAYVASTEVNVKM